MLFFFTHVDSSNFLFLDLSSNSFIQFVRRMTSAEEFSSSLGEMNAQSRIYAETKHTLLIESKLNNHYIMLAEQQIEQGLANWWE